MGNIENGVFLLLHSNYFKEANLKEKSFQQNNIKKLEQIYCIQSQRVK
jgi:hypothetical protein